MERVAADTMEQDWGRGPNDQLSRLQRSGMSSRSPTLPFPVPAATRVNRDLDDVVAPIETVAGYKRRVAALDGAGMTSHSGRFKVFVDDNFHYMDQSERYAAGEFDTLVAAITACERIVDRSLVACYRPGMTAEALLSAYKMFGDDPFVLSDEGTLPPFSAWRYAERKARDMCTGAK